MRFLHGEAIQKLGEHWIAAPSKKRWARNDGGRNDDGVNLILVAAERESLRIVRGQNVLHAREK